MKWAILTIFYLTKTMLLLFSWRYTNCFLLLKSVSSWTHLELHYWVLLVSFKKNICYQDKTLFKHMTEHLPWNTWIYMYPNLIHIPSWVLITGWIYGSKTFEIWYNEVIPAICRTSWSTHYQMDSLSDLQSAVEKHHLSACW